MEERRKWTDVNINAGLLVALMLGVAAVFGASEGFRTWVDNRINLVVEPIAADLERLWNRLDSDDRRRSQQYGRLRQDICHVLQALDEPCPPGVDPASE